MKYNLLKQLAATFLFIACTTSLTMPATAAPAAVDAIFNTAEILDESTLDIKILQIGMRTRLQARRDRS